jgi:aldehyde dehydrogenase (NAD+)
MRVYEQFYIGGEWLAPLNPRPLDVINPATEQSCATISLGSADDVERAVSAARKAFTSYCRSSREERIDLLSRIVEAYQRRYNDIADAISEEMGAPTKLAIQAQAGIGLGHLTTTLDILKSYNFEDSAGNSRIVKEPIGVCGLITPWNWPMNQIVCKVAPALAVGCTVILKPSEIAPLSAYVLSEILHEAGVPGGIYNMINGDGPGVGSALATHPDIDMVSFTGSTRAGIQVAQNAAPTVKRVTQELGGKSANILLPDVDLDNAVSSGTMQMFMNSGQSCNAPSRMLVPVDKLEQAARIAARVAGSIVVGDPKDENTTMGPVASKAQFDKIQALIQAGIDEGASLICGGIGRPPGLKKGYFVQPTVFSAVNNRMTIAREEIFGPVLCILPYQDIDDAIAIANDTPYGLAGYVQGKDTEQVLYVASRVRAGNINVNGVSGDLMTPFGGYKQSGNGREWGVYGFGDYLETKAIAGAPDSPPTVTT